MEIELLNDYKKTFIQKRYLQTNFGGLNLKIGNDAPFYAYLIQVIIFLIPWLIGGFFTLLLEFQVLGGNTPSYVYVIVYGVVVFLFVMCTQLTSFMLQRRTSQVTRLHERTANILSEEDEIEFDSCLSPHVIQFLIPVKKYKVNIVLHSLVAGFMCGFGLLYLAPSTFHTLFSSAATTVILYICGWLVLCNAQYSLTVTAPPELATFRTTDSAELASLTRPFYVIVFLAVDVLWRYIPADLTPQLTVVNQILHIAFVTLPILWSLGFLPPLEALFLWLMEQVLILGLGGSPMATNLRLIVMLFMSVCAVTVCSLLPSTLAVVTCSSLVGYILSVDLFGLANFALQRIRRIMKKNPPVGHVKSVTNSVDDKMVLVQHATHWGLVTLHHMVLLFITCGITIGMHFYSSSFSSTIWQVLGITIIVSAKLETWLRQFQQVYIFGLFRNCLYPKDMNSREKFYKRKKRLRLVGWCHKFVINFVMPLLMVVYVSLGTSSSTLTPPSFILALGSVRAFRWIWQNTSDSLLEISVVHFINSVVQPSVTSSWSFMGLGLQLLTVSVTRDRLVQILHKLYTYFTILVTSYTVKKQRRSSTVPLLVVSLIFFPITFIIIVTAGALSAPLLPLFTLPVILIGFPRSMRTWPGQVGGSASVCADSIYYEEMMPQLVAAVQRSLSFGSLGSPQPGYHYILRFQDRMAWVQVLERGFGFYTLSIKGMELQETSCHTVEAGELEAQFQVAFENEQAGCFSLNPYIAHTMTPMDVVTFTTYSDAKSTLTGIIDSPDTLERIEEALRKTLVWVLARHTIQKKDYSPRKQTSNLFQDKKVNSTFSPAKSEGFQSDTLSTSDQGKNLAKIVENREPSKDSGHPESSQSRPHSVMSYELKKSTSWSSLGSFGDDGLELDTIQEKKPKPEQDGRTSIDDLFDDLPGTIKEVDEDEDELLKELEFGLPVIDKGTPKHTSQNQNLGFAPGKSHGIKLASSIQFTSSYSSKLSLPFKWREIPIDPEKVQSQLGKFPGEWFKSILLHLQLGEAGNSSEEVVEEMMSDTALVEMYSYLTAACHLVVCGEGLTNQEGGKGGSWHVYRSYSGDFPWSPYLEWLTEDEELLSIVKQAFRLAFKLAYDQVVLGEGDDDEEVIECLEEYETSWYLGSDTDEEWKDAIKKQKQQLFSLMFNAAENTYHGRVLSRHPVMAHMGSLNQEMVRALWSSLSLELLYMTNDDEERYSIQAHPVILRNLTIQSADPPLGYPIYASPPISVPTL